MELKHPPHRYTEVRVVDGIINGFNGPWLVAAYMDDLTSVERSGLMHDIEKAIKLQQELQATCRAARRLMGLPTPNLNRPS